MSHGFRGNSTAPARNFVNFERLLIEDGSSCLRFDQPGSGNSEGDFSQSSFDTWIETIVHVASHNLNAGYRVALLGQSMGPTGTMLAAARPELRERVPCVLLWVPDARSTFEDEPGEFGEEGGQRYPTRFWRRSVGVRVFGKPRSLRGRDTPGLRRRRRLRRP